MHFNGETGKGESDLCSWIHEVIFSYYVKSTSDAADFLEDIFHASPTDILYPFVILKYQVK